MAGYTKLFSTILDSTVWQEPAETRLTWITMLAMADQQGVVSSSIPGLAKRAGVSLDGCEHALATFLAPDRYSRTKDHDGRRIEPVQGGWVLLNHAHYRELREREDRREQARLGMQQLRERRKAEGVNETVNVLPKVNHVGEASASASASAPESKPLRTSGALLAESSKLGFDEFWAAYPVKKGKVRALKTWVSRRLGAQLRTILADVAARKKSDPDWARGAIPWGSTYVSEERWQDALAPDVVASDRPVVGCSPAVVDTPEERKRKHEENERIVRKMMEEAGHGS